MNYIDNRSPRASWLVKLNDRTPIHAWVGINAVYDIAQNIKQEKQI